MSLQQRDCSGFTPDSLLITFRRNAKVNHCGCKDKNNSSDEKGKNCFLQNNYQTHLPEQLIYKDINRHKKEKDQLLSLLLIKGSIKFTINSDCT